APPVHRPSRRPVRMVPLSGEQLLRGGAPTLRRPVRRMTALASPLQWPGAVLRTARPLGLGPLVFMLVAFGSLYGAAMGSFWSGDAGVRPLQMLYSALKVPMLLVVTFALSLPSYFVINTLLGLREDFAEAIRA